jgi:hypothetical protein
MLDAPLVVEHSQAVGDRCSCGARWSDRIVRLLGRSTEKGKRQRPRRRSISRRSFFVGRPAEGSRRGTAATVSRSGGGGLWSMKHVTATGAPTRLSSTSRISNIRSRSPTRAVTVSPTRTEVDGFAPAPLTLTWPDRTNAVDADRVGAARTAHNHLSTRVTSTRQASRAPDRDVASGLGRSCFDGFDNRLGYGI